MGADMKKQMAELLGAAQKQGWVLERTKTHSVLRHNGTMLTLSRTPSSYRGVRNDIAKFRRMGGVFPYVAPPKIKERTKMAVIAKPSPVPVVPTGDIKADVIKFLADSTAARSGEAIITRLRELGYTQHDRILRDAIGKRRKAGAIVAARWEKVGPGWAAYYTTKGRATNQPDPMGRDRRNPNKAKVVAPKPTTMGAATVVMVDKESQEGFKKLARQMDKIDAARATVREAQAKGETQSPEIVREKFTPDPFWAALSRAALALGDAFAYAAAGKGKKT